MTASAHDIHHNLQHLCLIFAENDWENFDSDTLSHRKFPAVTHLTLSFEISEPEISLLHLDATLPNLISSSLYMESLPSDSSHVTLFLKNPMLKILHLSVRDQDASRIFEALTLPHTNNITNGPTDILLPRLSSLGIKVNSTTTALRTGHVKEIVRMVSSRMANPQDGTHEFTPLSSVHLIAKFSRRARERLDEKSGIFREAGLELRVDDLDEVEANGRDISRQDLSYWKDGTNALDLIHL